MLLQQEIHPNAKFWLEVADTVIKVVAVMVGAAWTWMHYVRGRTFKPRLDLGVTARVFRKGGALYVLSTCTVKNIGLSKCEFKKKGTGCEIMGLTLDGPEKIATFGTFPEHGWIEPGEDLQHTSLVPVPEEKEIIAIRVSLRVVSGEIRWICRDVIEVPDAEHPVDPGKAFVRS